MIISGQCLAWRCDALSARDASSDLGHFINLAAESALACLAGVNPFINKYSVPSHTAYIP